MAAILYFYRMRWLLLCLLFTTKFWAQNDLLGKNYFERGEYQKAVLIYETLFEENPQRMDWLDKLIVSYQQLENFEAAQQTLTKVLSKKPFRPQLYVSLGYTYALQKNDSLTQEAYNKALESIRSQPFYAYSVGRAFHNLGLLDNALKAYLIGLEYDPSLNLKPQMALIYGEQGNLPLFFETYVDLIAENPAYITRAQRAFNMYVTENPENNANKILLRTLLQKTQTDPNILFNELLSWLFIQQHQYNKAFIQERAIYLRAAEGLNRISELALTAFDAKDYHTASTICHYILQETNNTSGIQDRLFAEFYLLKITMATANTNTLQEVSNAFETFFNTYGKNARTFPFQIEYYAFLAFKFNQVNTAISQLNNLINSAISAPQKAQAKMLLADVFVFTQQFNRALILYSQVQHDFENDPIAQNARFNVAKTSYYKGDFKWAQSQLDVLKKSVSQRIANDALYLSVLIRENTLEDSTKTALKGRKGGEGRSLLYL